MTARLGPEELGLLDERLNHVLDDGVGDLLHHGACDPCRWCHPAGAAEGTSPWSA